MKKIFLILVHCICLVRCTNDLEISKEVLNADWSGISHIELFYKDGTFYRESDHSLKLQLYNGGEGKIIRSSGTRSILWIAESYPDLFIYSENLGNNPTGLELFVTYIYEITYYDDDTFKLYNESFYTENGIELVRKSYWNLTKD